MRRFLTKLLCYLVPLTALSAGISFYYNRIIMHDSNIERKERQFAAYCDSTEILFVGDSHVMYGIQPLDIDGAFNLAVSSENTIQTYYRLLHLFEKASCGKNIRCLFLPFEQHTFSSQRLDSRTATAWSNTYFYNRFINPFIAGAATGDRIGFLLRYIESFVWSYQNDGVTIIDRIKDHPGSPAELRPIFRGFPPRPQRLSDKPDSVQVLDSEKRASFHLDSGRYNLHSPVLIEFFFKILDLCDKHHVEVVLISMPVTHRYYEYGIGKYGADNRHQQLDSLLSQYPNLHRLDYTDMFFDRNEYFADPDHVNEAGANLLSKKIAEDIAVLGL